jgi:hypothetical protein
MSSATKSNLWELRATQPTRNHQDLNSHPDIGSTDLVINGVRMRD